MTDTCKCNRCAAPAAFAADIDKAIAGFEQIGYPGTVVVASIKALAIAVKFLLLRGAR